MNKIFQVKDITYDLGLFRRFKYFMSPRINKITCGKIHLAIYELITHQYKAVLTMLQQ